MRAVFKPKGGRKNTLLKVRFEIRKPWLGIVGNGFFFFFNFFSRTHISISGRFEDNKETQMVPYSINNTTNLIENPFSAKPIARE